MKKMYIAEALREAIREEMRRDESVFCIGEDIGTEGGFGGAFTVTLDLWKEFGHERILDTPISEAGIAGVAEIAAIVADEAFDLLDAPIKRVCAPDTPVPFSPVMENYYIPNARDIIREVKKLCR